MVSLLLSRLFASHGLLLLMLPRRLALPCGHRGGRPLRSTSRTRERLAKQREEVVPASQRPHSGWIVSFEAGLWRH